MVSTDASHSDSDHLLNSASGSDASSVPDAQASTEEDRDSASQRVYLVGLGPEDRILAQGVVERAGWTFESFEDEQVFLRDANRSIPGCAVMDLVGGGRGALGALQEMRQNGWGLPVILLTPPIGSTGRQQSVRDGAICFMNKPLEPQRFAQTISDALELDDRQRSQAAQQARVEAKLAHLTPRENQVVDLIVQGRRTRQIAEELFISVKTVETHRDNIMKKLAASNVAEVVRIVTTRDILCQSNSTA